MNSRHALDIVSQVHDVTTRPRKPYEEIWINVSAVHLLVLMGRFETGILIVYQEHKNAVVWYIENKSEWPSDSEPELRIVSSNQLVINGNIYPLQPTPIRPT